MYDHNTQRPRGFGFITYDSGEAVDRVLHKSFHELNGKMVEVKRAVPKELSSGPNRSPLLGYNYCFGRTNNFFSSQGYNLGRREGYGVTINERPNPVVSRRSTFSPIGSPAYGIIMSLEPGMSPSFGGSSGISNIIGYGQTLSLGSGGNSNRYVTPIGFNGRNESFLSSPTRNGWPNVDLSSSANVAPAGTYTRSGSRSSGVFGNSMASWGFSPFSGQGGGIASGYSSNIGYGSGENNYRLGATGLGRNIGPGEVTTSPFASSPGDFEQSYGDLYGANSRFGDVPWQSASSEIDGSASFNYVLGPVAESTVRSSEEYGMLCLVGVNDSGRNGMKNELYYGQLLTNFIPSSIPFLTLCTRDHTFNLRWNAPFSPTPNFFSNLIIAILPHLHLFQNFLPISISFK
ncbi:heterogeneous nuclear ribonucleoprotein 1-like [Daucus carota subsp. sativus]